jgi:hypothetical protein
MVVARVNSVNVNVNVLGVEDCVVGMDVGMNNGGSTVNDTMVAHLGVLSLLSVAMINLALKTAVMNYINTTYGLTITLLDVAFPGSPI